VIHRFLKKPYKPSIGFLHFVAAIYGKKYAAMSKKERREFEKWWNTERAKRQRKTAKKNEN
jgi:hypothetical protein